MREVMIETETRRIEGIYETCIGQCNVIREEELDQSRLQAAELDKNRDKESEAPRRVPKKRGRPKINPVYATVYTHLMDVHLQNEGGEFESSRLVVRTPVNNVEIREWRNKAIDAINKQKYEDLVEDPRVVDRVDWDAVSNKLVSSECGI
jgi:hypothetical protein